MRCKLQNNLQCRLSRASIFDWSDHGPANQCTTPVNIWIPAHILQSFLLRTGSLSVISPASVWDAEHSTAFKKYIKKHSECYQWSNIAKWCGSSFSQVYAPLFSLPPLWSVVDVESGVPSAEEMLRSKHKRFPLLSLVLLKMVLLWPPSANQLFSFLAHSCLILLQTKGAVCHVLFFLPKL